MLKERSEISTAQHCDGNLRRKDIPGNYPPKFLWIQLINNLQHFQLGLYVDYHFLNTVNKVLKNTFMPPTKENYCR